MLSDERARNGVINRRRRWPAKTVPFFIDRVFGEYCSSKIQIGLGAWRELSMHYDCCFSSKAHWSLSGRSNGDNYLP